MTADVGRWAQEIIANPALAEETIDIIECVTQAEKDIPEAAPYLEVYDGWAVAIATSRLCPTEDGERCGGHPVCRPCLELGKANGWIVEVTG